MTGIQLQDWLTEEQRLTERAATAHAAPLDPIVSSGLELMQAALTSAGLAPIGQTLDFRLVEIDYGRAVFQGTPGRAHYNPLGTVHGGWFASLLDSAVGCAVHSTLAAGQSYTTLELKVNYVRPLNEGVARVRAIGTVIHAGRRVATAEARLIGPDDKLYAHATTTCLIFDLEPST